MPKKREFWAKQIAQTPLTCLAVLAFLLVPGMHSCCNSGSTARTQLITFENVTFFAFTRRFENRIRGVIQNVSFSDILQKFLTFGCQIVILTQ